MKRVGYIDYMKWYGILLIMLAHCIQAFSSMSLVNRYVTSFHVPIFFMASGCLCAHKSIKQHADEDFRTFSKKKIYSLIIPYIVFSLFNTVQKLGVYALASKVTTEMIHEELIALFVTGNGTVWFLMTLFIVELIFEGVIRKFLRTGILVCITVVGLLVSFIVNTQNPAWVFLLRIPAAISFYIMGYLLVNILESNDERTADQRIAKGKIEGIAGACLVVFGVFACFMVGGELNFFEAVFKGGILISSIPSCVGYMLLCRYISKDLSGTFFDKFITHFGNKSLLYMLAHPTFMMCITFPFGARLFATQGPLNGILAILVYVSVLVMTTVAVFFMDKYLKYSIGKGYRKNPNISAF